MGYANLNLWVRFEDCSLFNSWRLNIEIKTCIGEYLFDQIPQPELDKILKGIQEQYPESSVTYDDYYGSRMIQIEKIRDKVINNVSIPVPPGCYVVRVHVCGKYNEWSDSAMVTVNCGCDACVNVIVNDFGKCINNVFVPFLREAERLRLPEEHVKIAADMMLKAGRIPIERFERNLNDRIKFFDKLDDDDAKQIVKEARTGLKHLKGIMRVK
jgi:hypothetical protein